MPSKKPLLAIRTEEEIINKLQIIANKENRSLSNLGETIVKKYIAAYEKENGCIETSTSTAKVSINKVEQNGPGTINIG